MKTPASKHPQEVQLEMKYADNVLDSIVATLSLGPRTPDYWKVSKMVDSYRTKRDAREVWSA